MTRSNTRFPSHAYVPGQTSRHEEGVFEAIRSSARDGMRVEALIGSQAFKSGNEFLDAGFFWEAHEVLEPVWLALPKDAPERDIVQGIIQLANAHLKVRMNRPKAALRLCDIAADLFRKDGSSRKSRINGEVYLVRVEALKAILQRL